jgi:uncharacterized NAD(P)/FAD-binding protein YdhS
MASTEAPRVAIVGAGFAGSATAAQLLRQATGPLDITLLERRFPIGSGRAFATTLPCHLLNVPAGRMSAYPDDPEHLLRWLGAGVPGYTFLPRATYGAYVEATLREAEQGSKARLTRLRGEAVGLSEHRLHLRDGATLEASRVVLALGNPPPLDPLEAFAPSRRYAPDPWEESALEGIAPGDTVATIGSNLTMIDVALALDFRRHEGPIVAISTHGLLPHPHSERPAPAWTSRWNGTAATPRQLLRALRAEARAASEWRSVVDAMRSYTTPIWSAWPDVERRRFTRHARPYWEVHRHRMAPENAETIAKIHRLGRLRVLAARIAGVVETPDGLEIALRHRGGSRQETIRAAKLVNCTGPGMDFRRSRDPLVMDLLARGLVRPGPLGMGFDAGPGGALIGTDGRPSTSLFTLGPPLKGLYWETTAVPEIRVQAQDLAHRLISEAA